MMIPEPFDYFPEKGASQKINVFLMKEWWLPHFGLVLEGHIMGHEPI